MIFYMLYVIIGASGTGKSRILRAIQKDNSVRRNVEFFKQRTTRPRRENEDDLEYVFVDANAFFLESPNYSAISAFYNTNLAVPNVFYAIGHVPAYAASDSNSKGIMTACPALLEDFMMRNSNSIMNNLHIVHLIADYDHLANVYLNERGDDPHEVRRRLQHDQEDCIKMLALISSLKDAGLNYPRRYEVEVGPPRSFDQIYRSVRQLILS